MDDFASLAYLGLALKGSDENGSYESNLWLSADCSSIFYPLHLLFMPETMTQGIFQNTA